jgi:DNA end-binding protein Ku
MLEARDQGIVVWTLRFGDEVRPESEYFTGIEKKGDAKGISALETIIKKKMADWSPEMASDPVQESLIKLIADKKKAKKRSGKTKSKASKSDDQHESNVVNIMDALKKSVAKELKARKAG